MKELTHKGRSWRGKPIETRQVSNSEWTITQVRQDDGSWWNIRIEPRQLEQPKAPK